MPPTKKRGEIKLKINGYDDRRNLVAILADNGYKVRIKKVKKEEWRMYSDEDYFVIIEL